MRKQSCPELYSTISLGLNEDFSDATVTTGRIIK